MVGSIEKNSALKELVGWVTINMLAMFFVGFSIFLPNILQVTGSNNTVYQIALLVATISTLGGGIIIALCQWIFLRRLLPKITGGGWAWVISGVIGSMGVFLVMACSILAMGDYPRQIDYLLFSVLVVAEQMIFLSLAQGLLLHANKYERVARTVLWGVFGYGLVAVFSTNLIFRWTDSLAAFIIVPVLLMTLPTGVSGWGLMHIRQARDDTQADNSIQETSPKYRRVNFVRANLDNQDLRGQNFDGADFRKASLRMAVLEEVSCEPIPVKKLHWGWLLVSLVTSSQRIAVEHGPMDPPTFREEMKPANFSEADLTGANLKGALLRGAIMRKAILRNANLAQASLAKANLTKADLSNADLSYTDLSDGLLYNANLEGADLTGAKLDGADFEDANLKDAKLRDLDLRTVKYLGSANLAGADLSGTTMPENK